MRLVGGDFLTTAREPAEIIAEAMAAYRPCRTFVGFSGGDDSLVATHWMMENVPDCEVVHFNTGIGIKRTREYVRDLCAARNWPLHEIRAEEDCGQSYRDLVIRYGFPGPAHHQLMYNHLKDRCADYLVRTFKTNWHSKIMIATGVYYEESKRRKKYRARVVNTHHAKVWVNPLYFWPSSRFREYRIAHKLPRNPVAEQLGMSGECLCGAFAHKGELALIRIVDPDTAAYLEQLEAEVRAAGHDWGWEDRPPRGSKMPKPRASFFNVMCAGCEKHNG